ncbi:MAG: peptide deformylase [Patescibacteria group bacterium]
MQITKEPNKILHKKLEPVGEITPEILELIEEMRKTMIEAKGVGLAANQVGKDLQIFIIDKKIAEEHKVPDAYINPEMNEFSRDKDEMEEGCLSMPDYWRQIPRSKKVRLKALDEHGNKIKLKARGFLARIFQHEYDHLQGTLIKDRLLRD